VLLIEEAWKTSLDLRQALPSRGFDTMNTFLGRNQEPIELVRRATCLGRVGARQVFGNYFPAKNISGLGRPAGQQCAKQSQDLHVVPWLRVLRAFAATAAASGALEDVGERR
jgi:hypothetical protein